MGQKQTSVSEGNRIIDLKLAGYTLEEAAEETGWSLLCAPLVALLPR
jgi:hypothetical protein